MTRFHASVAAVLLAGVLSSSVSADTVVTCDGLPYKGTLTGESEEGVTLRWEMGGARKVFALKDIRRIEIDGCPELSRAETLMVEGQYAQASEAYLKAAQQARGLTQNIIAARLVPCWAAQGRFKLAVFTCVGMDRRGSPLAAGVVFRDPASMDASVRKAALAAIEEGLKGPPPPRSAKALRGFKRRILAAPPAVAGQESGFGPSREPDPDSVVWSPPLDAEGRVTVVQAATPVPEEIRKVFDEFFGEDVKRALASADGADDGALAERILAEAERRKGYKDFAAYALDQVVVLGGGSGNRPDLAYRALTTQRK